MKKIIEDINVQIMWVERVHNDIRAAIRKMTFYHYILYTSLFISCTLITGTLVTWYNTEPLHMLISTLVHVAIVVPILWPHVSINHKFWTIINISLWVQAYKIISASAVMIIHLISGNNIF